MEKQAIEKTIRQVSNCLWIHGGEKPNFSNQLMLDATNIFVTVLMDKMWDLQEKENTPIEIRQDMAHKAGVEIREMVKKYTDLDTHKLMEEFLK